MARARKRHVQLVWTHGLRKPDKNGQFRGGTHKRQGRPKRGVRASERHKVRPELKGRFPVHIILRASADLGSLRTPAVFTAIREATLVAFKLEDSFHIVHYSIQRTHIHLIVEASGRLALAKGMQVFGISAAKHINAAVPPRDGRRRRGTVFADRYHAVILTNPTQVRNTLSYVLNNWRHHGEHTKPLRKPWKIDPYSTALAFDGWKERAEVGTRYRVPVGYAGPLVWLPKTWLLREGWRVRGLISIHETPGSGSGAE
ncbi:MAG: transposase [Kofleriaceae bacterium]